MGEYETDDSFILACGCCEAHSAYDGERARSFCGQNGHVSYQCGCCNLGGVFSRCTRHSRILYLLGLLFGVAVMVGVVSVVSELFR